LWGGTKEKKKNHPSKIPAVGGSWFQHKRDKGVAPPDPKKKKNQKNVTSPRKACRGDGDSGKKLIKSKNKKKRGEGGRGRENGTRGIRSYAGERYSERVRATHR